MGSENFEDFGFVRLRLRAGGASHGLGVKI